MKILYKILLTIPLLGLVVSLWAIGMKMILEDIHGGHIPMYKMALAFGVPEPAPLIMAIVLIIIFYFILWRSLLGSPLP